MTIGLAIGIVGLPSSTIVAARYGGLLALFPPLTVLIGVVAVSVVAILDIVETHWVTRTFSQDILEDEWRIFAFRPIDENAIPEFALQTACDLKERFPNFTFGIDVLEEKKEQPITYDPFLWMRGDWDVYYLEVWNEPGYKQERMV